MDDIDLKLRYELQPPKKRTKRGTEARCIECCIGAQWVREIYRTPRKCVACGTPTTTGRKV